VLLKRQVLLESLLEADYMVVAGTALLPFSLVLEELLWPERLHYLFFPR